VAEPLAVGFTYNYLLKKQYYVSNTVVTAYRAAVSKNGLNGEYFMR